MSQLYLMGMDRVGPCDMWAVGRHARGGLMPFAARLQRATWTDLGHGLAGASGIPSLADSGTLAGGTQVQLSLSNAAPSALVVGASRIELAFMRGVLVPSPDVVLLGPSTAAGGSLAYGIPWPHGLPSAMDVFFQAWLLDAAGPFGVAASNALRAQTP